MRSRWGLPVLGSGKAVSVQPHCGGWEVGGGVGAAKTRSPSMPRWGSGGPASSGSDASGRRSRLRLLSVPGRGRAMEAGYWVIGGEFEDSVFEERPERRPRPPAPYSAKRCEPQVRGGPPASRPSAGRSISHLASLSESLWKPDVSQHCAGCSAWTARFFLTVAALHN
jgi:hypothetical protein